MLASSQLIYDEDASRIRTKQSTQPLNYLLNPLKFSNCHSCRIEFGIVGGRDVSLNNTNLVDLESDLSGRTRVLSKYMCKDPYQPKCRKHRGGQCKKDVGLPYDCLECQEDKLHLRSCGMVKHPPRATTVGYTIEQPNCAEILQANKAGLPSMNAKSFTSYTAVQPYHPSRWQGNTGAAAFN